MFEEQYESLRASEKEEFAHCVNTLMLKSFILRDYYDDNLCLSVRYLLLASETALKVLAHSLHPLEFDIYCKLS